MAAVFGLLPWVRCGLEIVFDGRMFQLNLTLGVTV